MALDLATRPKAPGRLEFGATSTVSANGGAETSGPVDKLQFLAFVACDICGRPCQGEEQPSLSFWMMTCGHVLCSTEEHKHSKGRCTQCGIEGVEAYNLDDNIPEGLHHFLEAPTDVIESIGKTMEHVSQHMKDHVIDVLKFQNTQLQVQVTRLRREARERTTSMNNIRTQVQGMQGIVMELEAHKSEAAALRRANEELQRALDRSQQQSAPASFRPPSRIQPHRHHLERVVETDEEGFDSGPELARSMEQNLAAFQSFDTPRGLTTPALKVSADRITLRPSSRDSHSSPRSDNNGQTSGVVRNPRQELSKYRYADKGTPYSRPASAMGRTAPSFLSTPARPFSAFGRPQGSHRVPTTMPTPSHPLTFTPRVAPQATPGRSREQRTAGGSFMDAFASTSNGHMTAEEHREQGHMFNPTSVQVIPSTGTAYYATGATQDQINNPQTYSNDSHHDPQDLRTGLQIAHHEDRPRPSF